LIKSRLERFIAKRVIIYILLLSIIDVIMLENKWFVLIGLIVGALLSVVKFSCNAWVLAGILGVDQAKRKKLSPGISAVLFTFSQLILLPLLFLAYYINQWVFAGFVAGILLVPLVIMINSITEAFGITKNHFE
jgi:hypothetical protein